MLDRPNERSSHSAPVVRGGGIAILLSVFLVGGFELDRSQGSAIITIAVAGLMLAAVSFMDDLRSLGQTIRFSVQSGAAFIAVVVLLRGDMHGCGAISKAAFGLIGFLWITGYTNSFNFMDGINGIAGMQTVVCGLGTALIGIVAGARTDNSAVIASVILAGAGAGFLPHNFPRARLFLGDVGSAPIGFLLAVIGFWIARDLGWWLLGAFGLLHANFVLDSLITLLRRVILGERWYESHREHFYQRLVRSGASHVLVATWEGSIQIVVLLVLLSAVRMGWMFRGFAAGMVFILWLAFFCFAEYRFRHQKFGAART